MQQAIKPQCTLVINRMLSSIGVDTNIVLYLVIALKEIVHLKMNTVITHPNVVSNLWNLVKKQKKKNNVIL